MKYLILLLISFPALASTAGSYNECMVKIEKIRNTKARDISNSDYGIMLKGCNYLLPKFQETAPIEDKEVTRLKAENAYLKSAYARTTEALAGKCR